MTHFESKNKKTALASYVGNLYDSLGQKKPMGRPAAHPDLPHYFLHRTFLGENDLLIIFNTKRCRYQCHFCTLPAKCQKSAPSSASIVLQFTHVLGEMKHSLSVLDRLTFSNEGNMLDADTFPNDALYEIATGIGEMRRLSTLVLETRLKFVDVNVVRKLQFMIPRVRIDILAGFETHSPYIRNAILGKNENLGEFERGLDAVAASGATLSAYILYKPDPEMSDEDAFFEAKVSIDYIAAECKRRNIPINCIRINPMYAARGSRWAEEAKKIPEYKPPKLTDVMRLAEAKSQDGLRIYIGLSTEGQDEPGCSYHSREDYSPRLIRPIKLWNDRRIASFGKLL